jgi:hypothetical protein
LQESLEREVFHGSRVSAHQVVTGLLPVSPESRLAYALRIPAAFCHRKQALCFEIFFGGETSRRSLLKQKKHAYTDSSFILPPSIYQRCAVVTGQIASDVASAPAAQAPSEVARHTRLARLHVISSRDEQEKYEMSRLVSWAFGVNEKASSLTPQWHNLSASTRLSKKQKAFYQDCSRQTLGQSTFGQCWTMEWPKRCSCQSIVTLEDRLRHGSPIRLVEQLSPGYTSLTNLGIFSISSSPLHTLQSRIYGQSGDPDIPLLI